MVKFVGAVLVGNGLRSFLLLKCHLLMRRGTEAVITAPPRKRMGASHVGSNPTLSDLSFNNLIWPLPASSTNVEHFLAALGQLAV